MEPLNRFDFYQHALVDEQINSKGRFKPGPFQFDIDRLLPINRISLSDQLPGEHGLVNGFQQTRPNFSMEPDR
jgi:hypothetical protein